MGDHDRLSKEACDSCDERSLRHRCVHVNDVAARYLTNERERERRHDDGTAQASQGWYADDAYTIQSFSRWQPRIVSRGQHRDGMAACRHPLCEPTGHYGQPSPMWVIERQRGEDAHGLAVSRPARPTEPSSAAGQAPMNAATLARRLREARRTSRGRPSSPARPLRNDEGRKRHPQSRDA
jgi:hypothetical protein